MKFFTKYSLFSNVISMVIVAASIMYISHEALSGQDSRRLPASERVELTAFNFHYNSYNEMGNLTTSFIAAKLEQYVTQDVKMTTLFETSYNKESGRKTWDVRSKYGFSSKKGNGNLIRLLDNVNSIMYINSGDKDDSNSKVIANNKDDNSNKVINKNKKANDNKVNNEIKETKKSKSINKAIGNEDNKATDDDQKYLSKKIYIKTSEMFYDNNTNDFYNDRFVKMYDPAKGNDTTGVGVKGNSDTSIINVLSDVRSYYATS